MRLHLHSNAIGTRGLEALTAAMERDAFPRLEVLTLQENDVGDFGGLAAAVTRGALPSIESILVDDNPGSGSLVRHALRERKKAQSQ